MTYMTHKYNLSVGLSDFIVVFHRRQDLRVQLELGQHAGRSDYILQAFPKS